MSELLSCEALTKCYQKDKTALENVDLHIGFGRIVGLLGPNGSGKTTLIKLANGLLQPSAGSIRIAGMTPGPDTKAIVSYLPDADWLPDQDPLQGQQGKGAADPGHEPRRKALPAG